MSGTSETIPPHRSAHVHASSIRDVTAMLNLIPPLPTSLEDPSGLTTQILEDVRHGLQARVQDVYNFIEPQARQTNTHTQSHSHVIDYDRTYDPITQVTSLPDAPARTTIVNVPLTITTHDFKTIVFKNITSNISISENVPHLGSRTYTICASNDVVYRITQGKKLTFTQQQNGTQRRGSVLPAGHRLWFLDQPITEICIICDDRSYCSVVWKDCLVKEFTNFDRTLLYEDPVVEQDLQRLEYERLSTLHRNKQRELTVRVTNGRLEFPHKAVFKNLKIHASKRAEIEGHHTRTTALSMISHHTSTICDFISKGTLNVRARGQSQIYAFHSPEVQPEVSSSLHTKVRFQIYLHCANIQDLMTRVQPSRNMSVSDTRRLHQYHRSVQDGRIMRQSVTISDVPIHQQGDRPRHRTQLSNATPTEISQNPRDLLYSGVRHLEQSVAPMSERIHGMFPHLSHPQHHFVNLNDRALGILFATNLQNEINAVREPVTYNVPDIQEHERHTEHSDNGLTNIHNSDIVLPTDDTINASTPIVTTPVASNTNLNLTHGVENRRRKSADAAERRQTIIENNNETNGEETNTGSPTPKRRKISNGKFNDNTAIQTKEAPVKNNTDIVRDKNICVICKESQSSTVIFPCMHMCLCVPCCTDMKTHSEANCPVCRKKIENIQVIYRS